MSAFGVADASRAADVIRPRLAGRAPEIAIVLGSGLGRLADALEDPVRVPYAEIPGFPKATVAGHAGALVGGTLSGRCVVALSGRFHLYEGHDVRVAAFPARVARALGAHTLVVSNAAGGIDRHWQPGDLMLMRDHLNLMFQNPLAGPVERGDARFPDMSSPYDPALCALARTVAREQGTLLREGTYAALLGPAYETPAEVRMLERFGADAVGMSTVPEVLAARASGMRVVGFSCITNLACGISHASITHEEVLAGSDRAAARLTRLVSAMVARMAAPRA